MGLKLPTESQRIESAETKDSSVDNPLLREVETIRPSITKPTPTTLPEDFPAAQSDSTHISFSPIDEAKSDSPPDARAAERAARDDNASNGASNLSKEEIRAKVRAFIDARAARTDKTPQTEIGPSREACDAMVEALKNGSPNGDPLMSLLGKELESDVSRYLLKQPNEGEVIGGPDAAMHPNTFGVGEMRPGLYGQRTSTLEAERLRRSDASGTEMLDKPAYFNDMQTVFGNSRYFDLVRNHNQVLSTAGNRTLDELVARNERESLNATTAAIQEKPNEPTVLFNFDSHSDMWAGEVGKGQESIAQWVNGVLRDNPNVNEVYWVLPQDFKDNPELRKHYFDDKCAHHDHVFVYADTDMTLYLDKANGSLLMKKPSDFSEDKYRQIEFHKRTLDDLPDFQGRRTAVSIDLDFFDNRGYDTAFGGAVSYGGDEGFAKFVQTLKDKNVRPEFTTVSASPEYVRDEHMRELLRFSTMVAEASDAKMDEVAVPKENQVYGMVAHDGRQVDRRGNKALELFDELFKLDAQTKTPTDSLDLNVSGVKLDNAVAATKRIYGVQSDEEARNILQKLDAKDGNANGVLEFEAMESLLIRVCRVNPEKKPLIKDPTGTQRDG